MRKAFLLAFTAVLWTASLTCDAQSLSPGRPAKTIFAQASQHAPRHASPGAVLATRKLSGTALTVPGRSIQYYWDGGISRWTGGYAQTNTYNSLGYLIQVINSDSATNTPERRLQLAYNAQGLVTEETQQAWTGSGYFNEYRVLYTYDARGREASYQYQQWQNNSWVTQDGSRTASTYSPAGTLIGEVVEGYNAVTATWQPESRATYTVNANNQWTELTVQGWESGGYVNDYRIRNITWHDWTKLLPSFYESQNWSSSTTTGTWLDDERVSITYQANGNYVILTQESVAPNTWVNESRTTINFDSFGNEVLYQDEEWTGTTWTVDELTRILLSYTATNQVRRSAEQRFNFQQGRYVNDYLITYSNFVVLATSRAAELAAGAALFPNPTPGGTTFSLAGLREQGPVQAEILNTLGQVVQTLDLRPRQGSIRQELTLQGLPAGLYTVRVHAAEGLLTKRVVKQ